MVAFARSGCFLALVWAVVPISAGLAEHSVASATNGLAEIEQVMAAAKPSDRLKGLAETAKKLRLEEIPAALEAVKAFRQLREQAVFREAVLKRWSELAPREAFVYIAALPESRIKLEAIRFAANKLASENCEEAGKAVEQLSASRSSNEAVDVVAGIWAKKNLHGALEWARALPAGFARESALNSIRFIWVHSDPVSASEHIGELPPGDTKNALLTNIAGEWAALDPPAALRWAKSLSDGPERHLALVNIAESWADADPAAAAGFALQLSTRLRQSAAAAVISRWATQNPEAAMEWALTTGDDAIQTRALSEVLNLWASVDAVKARQWVENLPAGRLRESAIQSYVQAVITWEPSQAVRLASTLKDDSAKIQQIDKCLHRWMELDRSAAQKWVRTSALPPDVKSKWLTEREP
jgi:hypothetical protein